MTVNRAALPREDDPEHAALRAELAVVRAEQAAQRARVEQLEARNGPRDAAEGAVLLAIAAAVGSRAFTSRELMAHAEQDPALGEALFEADITSARECGHLLRRLSWAAADGYRLVRAGSSRHGLIWEVRVSA